MHSQNTNQLQTFEMHRSLLFSIAYRMLGSVMEAEDMVQETYLRYINTAIDTIESPKAFLSTITTRLCLDHLKSAKVRREEYIGPWLPEPLRTDDATTPIDKYEMVSMAALVLLEKLSPLERAVFLLRGVFEYSYTEIAKIVEKSEANCRQSYHRARQYVHQNRPRFKTSPAAQQKLVKGFLQAIQTGDVDSLNALLANDVTLWSDGGGKATAARHPLVDKNRITRLLLVSYRKRPNNLDIELAEIKLNNIDFQFTSKDKMNLLSSIKKAEVYPQVIDLKNQKLEFKKVKVEGPLTKIELNQIDTLNEEGTIVIDDSGDIFGPINWLINCEDLELVEGGYAHDIVNTPVGENFDARHLNFSDINILAKEVLFSDSLLSAQINKIGLTDRDQVEVKDFHMDLAVKPGKLMVHDMELSTANSTVSGHLRINYPTLKTLADELDKVEIDIELAGNEIAIKDVLYYLPDLNGKEKLARLAEEKLNMGLRANGHLDELNIPYFTLGVANHLHLNIQAEISGLPDVSRIRYRMQIDTLSGDQYLFETTITDTFLTNRIPEWWQIKGSVNGGFYTFDSDVTIKSSEGDVYLSGYIDYRKENSDSSHVNIQTRHLNIGRFTGAPFLDSLNLSAEVFAGNLAGLDGRLRGNIDRLIINNYQTGNISIDVQRERDISFNVKSHNESMDFQLDGVLSLLDSGFSANYNLDLKALNLLTLGFSERDFDLKAVSEGRYTYVSNSGLEGSTQIKGLEIKADSILHAIGDVYFASTLKKEETSFEVNSKVVDGYLAANTNVEDFIIIIRSQFGNYIPINDTIKDFTDKYVEFDFDFHDAEALADVFLQNIDTLQISRFSGNYNGSLKELTGNLAISDFIYSGIGFQDINLEILSDQDSLNVRLGIAAIYYDTIQLRNLSFETKMKDNFIDLRMSKVNDKGRIQYLLENQIVYTDDNIEIIFPEDGLIWDYQKWIRSGSNKLFLLDSANSIRYSKGDQEISFKSEDSELVVDFHDFEVTNFINAIEYGDSIPILDGRLNGELTFQTKPPALFEVDLNFDDLRLRENELGNIELFAANNENSLYKFGLNTMYHENEFRIKGDYKHQSPDSYEYNIFYKG